MQRNDEWINLAIRGVVCFLLALPWLDPFTSGPAPHVHQTLTTGFVLGFLLICWSAFRFLGQNAEIPKFALLFAGGWLIAGCITAVIGLLQYFGVSDTLKPWVANSLFSEAVGNLRQRNQFASLTNITLAALLWIVASHKISKQIFGFLTVAAMLLSFANAASSSRTGLLQLMVLVVMGGLWGSWRKSRIRTILCVALVAYFSAVFLLPAAAGLDVSTQGVIARIRAGDSVCASRLTLWPNVLHLIAQKPWFGWGWGELDYAHYITLYNGPRFCDILDNAHNLPLHLAVELGIPVALLACGLFAWWIARQKPWRETDPTRQMAWAVLAVILLHSMLEYPLWYGPFQMATGLCIWMLWRPSPAVAARDPTDAFETVAGRTADSAVLQWHRIRIAVAVSMLVACAYAAWDYWRISQVYLPPSARDAAYRENTLEKIRGSWLFSNQVSFAELGMTGLTPANAQWTYDTATRMLHFSPEPRVIEKVIESATMLGRDDEALAHLARYRAAFPADYAKWALANKLPAPKT